MATVNRMASSITSETALIETQPLVQLEEQEEDEAADEVQTGPRRLRRAMAAFVASACLIMGVGLATHYGFFATRIRVPGSDGFINLSGGSTIDVSTLPGDHSPICDPGIVARVCKTLNTETLSYYNNSYDADMSVVHALELQEVFMIAKSSIVKALQKAGVTNLQGAEGEYAMKCQDLCQKMVATYSPKALPKYSNLACLWKGWGIFKQAVCEIDVHWKSTESLDMHRNVRGEMTAPEFMFEDREKKYEYIQSLVTAEEVEDGYSDDKAIKKAELMMNYKKVPFEVARQAIVNMFQIFPPIAATAVVKHWQETYEADGSKPPGGGIPTPTSLRRRLSNWDQTETLALAQQSIAYISQTLKRMAQRQIGNTVIEWYGSNDETTRTEIKRVLNGVHAMLAFVEYKYPGSYCQPNYYAYVFPGESYDQYGNRLDKNSQGQYIFYLCDYYFKSDTASKVETLLHEGSHHLQMALKDSEYRGATMYGKAACKHAAKSCKSGNTDSCILALRNADTFCYFTNSAHTPAPTPAPPALAAGIDAGGFMDSFR